MSGVGVGRYPRDVEAAVFQAQRIARMGAQEFGQQPRRLDRRLGDVIREPLQLSARVGVLDRGGRLGC